MHGTVMISYVYTTALDDDDDDDSINLLLIFTFVSLVIPSECYHSISVRLPLMVCYSYG